MRVLIFHGYLLGGTGSNVYNASLAAALARRGHDVHLLCQERHPEDLGFVDRAGDWDGGALAMRELRTRPAEVRGGVSVYRPDIGGLLPVYVADRYEAVEARTFAECSDAEVAEYVERNAAAVAEVSALVQPDLALANHLVMGPAILARGLPNEVRYAVKVHGSALEYTVKPQPERFLGYASEGLRRAEGVLVGSRHTAESLWGALGDPSLPARTRLGPPGVDVEQFAPREPVRARAGLEGLAVTLARREGSGGQGGAPAAGHPSSGDAFARDPAQAARALAAIDPASDRLVVFVGKLIVSKGVDLLVAAWPLVLAREPRARLVVVGFGAFREGLERLIAALAAGDIDAARAIARAGRALEGDSPPGEGPPLGHLLAFLDGLDGDELERFRAASASLPERIVLTGRLDHDELVELLPACEAMVVPSSFPESFGMVAAEAAACGVLPVSAAHSGLAEVSRELAAAVPAEAAPWLSFPVDDNAVPAIAGALTGWLAAGPGVRERTRAGLVATTRARWSWEGVAEGVLAAAAGRLEALRTP